MKSVLPKIKVMLGILLMLIVCAVSAHAAEREFQITVDRKTISLGESLQLKLTFEGTSTMAAPELPDVDGIEIRYVGPSSMVSIVNGHMTKSITHTYSVFPLKSGSFHIGPFSFDYKGTTYVSNDVTVTVKSSGGQSSISSPRPSANGSSSQEDSTLDDYVFLTMDVDTDKAYMNEIIPVTIKLYRARVRIGDVEYPTFTHEGFSVGDFGKPRQYEEAIGGIRYEVVEFHTEVFGTRPGKCTLGPATMKCNVLVKQQRHSRSSSFFDGFFGDDLFNDFFGRYAQHPVSLTASAKTMTILPLPEKDKPDEFTGTLGTFTFYAAAEPRTVKVGDPITLKMTITGKGNFNTVRVPKLTSEEGFKVYDPAIRQEAGKKYFEQILLPTNDTITEIPPLTFPFFDTKKGKYVTLSQGPFPIEVEKGAGGETLTLVEMPDASRKPIIQEVLGRDIIFIKQSTGTLRRKGAYLFTSPLYVGAHSIPFLFLVMGFLVAKRKRRLDTDVRYARRLHAPRKARKGIHEAQGYLRKKDREAFFGAVFRTLQEYIGNKFHLPSGGITSDVVDHILREKNIEVDIMSKLKHIFEVCDMARYAATSLSEAEMTQTFSDLKTIIDYLERKRV